jgi:hypothetical protein
MIVLAAPALPLHTAGPYVAAAYIVFVVVIVVYLAIMARRLRRAELELSSLRSELDARERGAQIDDSERDLEPVA